jgi:hypothetical protein
MTGRTFSGDGCSRAISAGSGLKIVWCSADMACSLRDREDISRYLVIVKIKISKNAARSFCAPCCAETRLSPAGIPDRVRRRLTRASRRAPEQSRHCRASSRARAVDVAVRWQLTVREPVRAIGHCPLALRSSRHHPAISAIGWTRWPPKRQIRWFYSRSVRDQDRATSAFLRNRHRCRKRQFRHGPQAEAGSHHEPNKNRTYCRPGGAAEPRAVSQKHDMTQPPKHVPWRKKHMP